VASLVDALRGILAERTRRRPVVVWYDPFGTLATALHQAAPDGVGVLEHRGSYLELRASFEEADPRLERRWLIYVPEPRPHPSWLRELELAGDLLELGLDGLVSEAFGLALTPRLRELLAGLPGRALAPRWEELVPPDPTTTDLERALVAAALQLGADAHLEEIVIEYVSRPDAPARLANLDLHPELRHLLEAEGGLGSLPEGEVPNQRVAAALLLSEAVVREGVDPQPFGEALPSAQRRPQWCSWAEAWMQRADDRSFRAWSERIGRLYRIREHLAGPGAVEVEAFAEADEVLLGAASGLLERGERGRLRAVAERRRDTYWARVAEARGEPLPWSTVVAALDLLEGVEAATAKVGGKEAWSLDELLGAYGGDEGWWRLDDAYRRLEAGWSRLPENLAEGLGIRAARAYGAFLDLLGIAAARALEACARWSAEGWEAQRAVAARALDDGSRVALVLADALRFDLGHLLAERLRARGLEVETIPTLADLPSVTQVGMAAIQSPAWEARELVIERRASFPRLGGAPVRTREDRLAQLRTRFPRAVAMELDAVQQARAIPLASPLVVYAGAVDEQGDSLPQVGLDIFERLVGGIADGVEKLLAAGYAKVVAIPDHGFVLVPREHDVRRVQAGDGGAATARARRYLVGRSADCEGMARVPLSQLGWKGEGAASFPRGLAVVSIPGEVPRFFHGGPMPQEVAVLSLICRRPAAAAPVDVRLAGPEHIDTTRPRFALEGEAEELLARPRRVRVVLRLDGRIVGESEPAEIAGGERTEVTVRLEHYGRHVEVLVEDVETREVLAERTLPVELPPGYQDFDL